MDRRLIALGFLTLGAAWSLAACAPSAVIQTPTAVAPVETLTPNPNLGCTAVDVLPTTIPLALSAPISEADYTSGSDSAPATMLVYCDLQSPQCQIFNTVLDELKSSRPSELRVVYRLFPVPASVVPALDKSELAAKAAIAAGDQDKFWKMRDLLVSHYTDWNALTPSGFADWLVARSSEIGMDAVRFRSDLNSAATSQAASKSYETAMQLGISSIPTVFINGQLQSRAAMTYSGLDSTVGLIALGSRQYRSCPPFEIDTTATYIATLHTEKGDITIRLLADRAPLAVNSFVFLARHGWFDGTTFHRVLPGFVAQGGDPSGTGQGGPGYYFKNEVFVDLKYDKPGVVGMANAGPDTNGSQFFITYAPAPQLDGSYTIFGQVINGMDVLEGLTPRDPQSTPGLPPGDKILSVTIQQQ